MVRFNKVWKTLEGYEFVSFQARIERDRVVRYLDFLEQKEPATLRPHACEDVGAMLPTFTFTLEMDAGVVADLAEVLAIPAHYLLHGEQSFVYKAPFRCGDLVTVESYIRDVTWKPDKHVCFFGKETHFLIGELLAVKSRSVYAVKTLKEHV
jgi:hypothetical protein